MVYFSCPQWSGDDSGLLTDFHTVFLLGVKDGETLAEGGESTETAMDEERIMGWTCCSESLDASQLNTCLAWMSFNKTWTGDSGLWCTCSALTKPPSYHLSFFPHITAIPTKVLRLFGLVRVPLHPSVIQINRKRFSIRLQLNIYILRWIF